MSSSITLLFQEIFYSIQSGVSSRAKNGGALFSAVSGFIQDPIAVPGLDRSQSVFYFVPQERQAKQARLPRTGLLMQKQCEPIFISLSLTLSCEQEPYEQIFLFLSLALWALSKSLGNNNLCADLSHFLACTLREAIEKKIWDNFPKSLKPTHSRFLFWDMGTQKVKFGSKRRFSGWFGEVWRGLDLVWESATPPTRNVFFGDLPFFHLNSLLIICSTSSLAL